MLLHKRSIIVVEVICLVLIATHEASSADYDYSEDENEKGSEYSEPDYTKYFGEKAAASGAVANKENPNSFESSFVYPVEYENFYFPPSGYNDPKSKGSSNKKTFAPQPNGKIDPYEEIKKHFEEEAATYVKPLTKDYFEESQKKQQQAEESEIQPGPHYVSHQLPVPKRFNDANDDEEDEAQSKDDVETIPPPLKGKHKGSKSSGSSYDSYKDPYGSDEEQNQQTKSEPLTFFGGKSADYDTGKSSSTVSQYPAANNYLASLKLPSTTLPSYQYNYQPVTSDYKALQSKYLESLANTPSPVKNTESSNLNEQKQDDGAVAPSDNVPENLKKKGCRRIEGPENAEDMNCFVCEDSGNKAKYTQCSYGSAEPANAGSSVAYSTPVKAPIRRKRSTYDSSKYDPYFEISQRSRKYFEDFEKEQQAAESERQKDFHYKPFGDDESYSESQSSELLKEPGACKKVERDGSICTVCKNPKTGGNFEQCSYASAPKEHKYAYVAEKKYDSEDEPEESKVELKHSSEDPEDGASSTQVTQSAEAPTEQFSSATKSKIIKDPIPELSAAGSSIEETSAESNESDPSTAESESDEESDSSEEQKEEKVPDYVPYYFNYGELKKDKKLVDDDPYDVPEHFAASVSHKKTANDDEDELGFDEYHYKLFPELNKEAESRNEEQITDATQQKQKPHDVEEVLAEFAKKDRSKCQKAEKNGMTCFLCVDQNKVQHEECMYIAESKPRPTHIAYHEVQRLKDPKDENHPLVSESSEAEESKKVETLSAQPSELVSETTKKKRFFKKVISTPLPLDNIELSAAASEVERIVVPYEKTNKGYVKETIKDSRASGSAPDSEQADEENKKKPVEEPETPKEIDVGDEEGAFSHETKPVYSKLFGTTLPKYMVEKTEFEKDFDAASGFD